MSIARAYALPFKVIRISGQDKLSYLHGQVTQDINLIKENNFMWSGHCSPKGKLWSVSRLTRLQDEYLMIASSAEAEASLRELKKYGVFAKVDIDFADCDVIGLITEDASTLAAAFNIELNSGATAFDVAQGKLLKLNDNRFLLLYFGGANLPNEIVLEANPAPFIASSILAGEPAIDADHIDEFVPQMVNLQALDGISFKKGCYTGQETVARMRYLGKNKRAMYVVSGTTVERIEETDIELQIEDNWRRGGKVIQQTFDTDTNLYYALAIMPNDTPHDAVLRAKNSPEVSLTIQPLPYSLEDN
ncbi:transcriptional regulator [Pseudoalteromonas piscicida]|uniref:CAF17-like 4Fe-4S cluster assembly/insertion protein YgfZ n=1 Tax=Pseudoalteromonas piscicida TaxID=43662 RepID=UPI0030963BCD